VAAPALPTPEEHAPHEPPVITPITPARRRGRGALAAIAAAGVAVAVAVVAFTVRAPGEERARVVPPVPPAASVAVMPVPEAAPERIAPPAPAPEPTPPVRITRVAPRPGARAVPPPAPPPVAVAAPAPPVQTETPAPAPPTATAVAELYGAIGRGLKRLDQVRGLDATIDLWPRYRTLRINDLLVHPEQRTRAAQLLEELRVEIARRE
jgi:hypothetical protein